ncbi:Alpha/beta hydrolase [Paramixta manurensis]|uniref:Alpha/beta hydrolase n=1 Tax=Paramixta manurensis TaxID=2740817 RepID=A0A6M8UJK8_9GAMM|nr:Alpha/beta hydrolase [Erwiniaceae bacterium PD-1]
MKLPDSEGLPLILLGGTLCDAALWQAVSDKLTVSDIRCIPLQGAHSAQSMADVLLETLPPRFLLAGFSLGAIVALHIMATAPQRLAGLALISVNPLVDSPENIAPRRRALAEARSVGLTAYLTEALWPRYVAAHRLDDVALCQTITAMAERCGLAVFAEQTDIAMHRHDQRSALGQLRVPITLLNGAEDPICTPWHHQAVAQAAPDARWLTFPACGHFVPLEEPELTAAALQHWINEAQRCDLTR